MLIFFAVQVDNEYLSQCKGCFSGLVHRFVVLGHEWGIYAMEEPRWVEWETQKGLFFYGVFLKGRREEAYPAYDA